MSPSMDDDDPVYEMGGSLPLRKLGMYGGTPRPRRWRNSGQGSSFQQVCLRALPYLPPSSSTIWTHNPDPHAHALSHNRPPFRCQFDVIAAVCVPASWPRHNESCTNASKHHSPSSGPCSTEVPRGAASYAGNSGSCDGGADRPQQ